MLLVGCLLLLLIWWIVSIGLKLAILLMSVPCGLVYKRLAGDCIVQTISGLENPDSKLLESFSECMKHIKEA